MITESLPQENQQNGTNGEQCGVICRSGGARRAARSSRTGSVEVPQKAVVVRRDGDAAVCTAAVDHAVGQLVEVAAEKALQLVAPHAVVGAAESALRVCRLASSCFIAVSLRLGLLYSCPANLLRDKLTGSSGDLAQKYRTKSRICPYLHKWPEMPILLKSGCAILFLLIF